MSGLYKAMVRKKIANKNKEKNKLVTKSPSTLITSGLRATDRPRLGIKEASQRIKDSLLPQYLYPEMLKLK